MSQCLSERSSKILSLLLEQKNPITINEISQKLNVSNRTIRYDLEELEDFLSKYDYVKIYKKARVGIWLEYDKEKIANLLNVIGLSKTYIKPLSTEERKYYIIKQLIQAEDIIKMQNLANELYVSRVTVHNDLEEVEQWLSKFGLKLIRKQNYGLQISGEEKDWRRAASELLAILKSNEELKHMLSETNELHYDSRIEYKNFNKIKELIPKVDLRVIETILNEAEEKFKISLTDEALEGLIVHIAISLKRLIDNKAVQIGTQQLNELIHTREYEVSKWIGSRLDTEFNLVFTESEIAYLALHILGSKLHENVQLNNENTLIENIDPKLQAFTKDIINLISNILLVDLNKDERLYKSLLLHLRPAINRMSYGLNLRNPLINDIKSKYPAIFGASWATSSLFEKYFNVKVSEEEIGYIAIHVGAALERIDRNLRAIVVCSSGIGTCELVAARLLRQVNKLNVLGTYSMLELKSLREEDFDFIITTIPLENQVAYKKPVVRISPLVGDDDINNINKAIKEIQKKSKNLETGNLQISNDNKHLFYKNLIFIKENIRDKKSIICKVCDVLAEKDYVEKEFVESVLSREKLTSTAVGKGVAIPHGENHLVKKSCISVVTLKEPIDWGKEKVDVIFFLALKFEDKNHVKEFFSYFYSILEDEEKLNKIRESNEAEEITKIFNKYM